MGRQPIVLLLGQLGCSVVYSLIEAEPNHLKGILEDMIYYEIMDIADVPVQGQEIPFLNPAGTLQRIFPKFHVKASH